MNNSSVPPAYSITSSDTITLSPLTTEQISALTTINTGSSSYYAGQGLTTSYGSMSGSTITISAGSSGNAYSIGGLTSDYVTTFKLPEEWVDRFPDWDKVKKMCEEYPGLKIAFEKFQTTYKLIVDHYDTPADQRPLP